MRIIYITLIAVVGLLLIPIGMLFSFTRAFLTVQWNPLPKFWVYVKSLGEALSQLLNATCSELFNDILITRDGMQFGDPEYTTSATLGANQQEGTLKPLGKAFVWVLDKVDPNHCIDAITDETICDCKMK
jgi:hypothetical protein